MKKLLLLTMFSVLTTALLLAQDKTVTGKVSDGETGERFPGVNILEKGTSNGTVTDIDGNYRVTVSEGATLVISYIGYESQEQIVGNRSVIDVSLVSDIQQLAEIVVIGYGTQDKKEITSAVTSVKAMVVIP